MGLGALAYVHARVHVCVRGCACVRACVCECARARVDKHGLLTKHEDGVRTNPHVFIRCTLSLSLSLSLSHTHTHTHGHTHEITNKICGTFSSIKHSPPICSNPAKTNTLTFETPILLPTIYQTNGVFSGNITLYTLVTFYMTPKHCLHMWVVCHQVRANV